MTCFNPPKSGGRGGLGGQARLADDPPLVAVTSQGLQALRSLLIPMRQRQWPAPRGPTRPISPIPRPCSPACPTASKVLPTKPPLYPARRIRSDFQRPDRRHRSRRQAHPGLQMRDQVGLVSFAPGQIVLAPFARLVPTSRANLPQQRRKSPLDLVGQLHRRGGEPSLLQQEQMAEEKMRAAVLTNPMSGVDRGIPRCHA